ncbi:ABC-type sugar transport system, periplasmic component [Xenococcus sp. PCC 7305]|uniref:ABC transporter substrate-binding protein n=1 Tax=Xenococcus sp. PCC 7305 TaxID=102125 RepID=UPI0002AD094C|nr:sugar ABC transporter substrate-binding protein [Xenococcus sp. PCC 7305]ELS02416.1 ABC-type sugar transport system, periplasmic component [Xenococcus sp. PCC 7305]
MRRLKICRWVSVSLLISGLGGCASTQNNNSEEIEFWTMQLQPKFNSYFEQINNTFAQDKAMPIRWIDIPWSAMESKILTAISAKTAPDVVNLNPNFASQLASRNAWLDLDEIVAPEEQKTYLPKIWQASSIEVCKDNNCEPFTFGLPWYLTTRVTIYNQKILADASLKQPPKNYQELATAARQIKNQTGKYAFFVTFAPGDSGEVLESMVQMGVTLVDDEGQAAFDSPEGRAAFRYWVELYQDKLLPPEVLTQGHRYAVELYQAGETAFLSSGAEFLTAIATNAPTIAEVSAAAPQITGKTGKKNVAVMNLAIPKDTNQPEKALDYALFVTNTNNQLAFAKEANVLPSTTDAVNQYIKELEQQETITPIEQARKVSALQLKDAEVLIPAMDNLQVLQKVIYENLQAAMLGEKTVDQAVQDAATEWDNQ